jgi:hypothetical protein
MLLLALLQPALKVFLPFLGFIHGLDLFQSKLDAYGYDDVIMHLAMGYVELADNPKPVLLVQVHAVPATADRFSTVLDEPGQQALDFAVILCVFELGIYRQASFMVAFPILRLVVWWVIDRAIECVRTFCVEYFEQEFLGVEVVLSWHFWVHVVGNLSRRIHACEWIYPEFSRAHFLSQKLGYRPQRECPFTRLAPLPAKLDLNRS